MPEKVPHIITDHLPEDENQAFKVFEVLFKTYFEPLCKSVYRMVRDKAVSEDIVQDVFLKTWKNRSKLDFSQPVKSYLFKAAINTAINHLEASKNKFSIDDMAFEINNMATTAVDQQIQYKEVQIMLEKTMNMLPPKCKAIFILIKYEEMTYAEAAESLGISVKTVENQMGKALKHMREHMQEYLGYLLALFLAFNE